MGLILNIETATKNCSVSLADKGKLLALKELNDGNYSHAEKLHVFIKDVLEQANTSFSNLDAIAVSKGPGSYTGLRIGVSAAKGLCFALDIPLIAAQTLETLAKQLQPKTDYIVPMLDARRLEVYSAVYNSKFELIRAIEAQVLGATSFDEYLNKGSISFIGDGVSKTKDIIRNENANYIEGCLPSAKEMAQHSYDKYCAKQFENSAYFEPFYLKDFVVTTKKK
ncbi:tRNA (adenosine(37)-N6)-threonylcarbamoyltransferase complex dimerization subunit type 1 TsaB [Urechidicola sp. KH5]